MTAFAKSVRLEPSERTAPEVTDSTTAAVAAAVVFVCMSLMVWASVYFGSFYDDEIANISILDKSFHDIIVFANSLDVHPPGQYVINKALLIVFGNLGLVKIVSGCLSAATLATFLFTARNRMAPPTFLVLAFLFATMSTVTLWDASLRWYSYFNAIFFLVAGIVLFSRWSYRAQLTLLAVAAVALFHIGYLAICAVPVLCVALLWRNRHHLSVANIVLTVVAGAIALAICIPQAWFLIHVHMASKGAQVSSLIAALAQTGMTVALGNSVFPVSIAATFYSLAVAICIVVLLATRRARELDYLMIALLTVGVALMALSGIGMKPRNSVYLLPFMAILIASAITRVPRIVAACGLAVVVCFQTLGVWNVVAHANTLKGSYNMPYNNIMATLDRDTKDCARTIVFHHDPVVSYLLQGSRFEQSTPWIKGAPEVDVKAGDCIAVIKTYRGVFSADDLKRFYTITDNSLLREYTSSDLDEDRLAARKSMIGKEQFPRFYAHLDFLRAENSVTLPDWSTVKYRSFFLDPNT